MIAMSIITVLCYLIMLADGSTICRCQTTPPIITTSAPQLERTNAKRLRKPELYR